jgi:hypothetical protein
MKGLSVPMKLPHAARWRMPRGLSRTPEAVPKEVA